jgi:hypothetical protein
VRRFFFLVQALLTVCAGAAWLAGCPATTTVGIAPITAISVPISTLLSDSELGCSGAEGGPNDVYKYLVVVAYDQSDNPNDQNPPMFDNCPATPLAGGVFDCFAEATFGNLPLEEAGLRLEDSGGALPDGGSVTIWEWVALYNFDTYERLKDDIADAVTGRKGKTICGIAAPTWQTTCVATEQDNLDTSPHCNLLATPAAATPDAAPKHPAKDAAVEAAPDAHGDAPPG